MINRLAKDAALIVVDQQKDFEPKGALPVPGGHEIAPAISMLMQAFSFVVVTQDSHPKGHISFASSYKAKKPFDTLTYEEVEAGVVRSEFSQETLTKYLSKVSGRSQVLWPDHCVIGSEGWEINPLLPMHRASLVLQKGNRIDCDSYSVFFENDGTSTGLSGMLRERGIKTIVLAGLAGDYCVFWSARDARRLGFEVFFDERLTRFIDFPAGTKSKVLAEMRELGVILQLDK